MKLKLSIYLFLFACLNSCTNEVTIEERLNQSFISLCDSLTATGFKFHQNIKEIYYPKSISENKIEGALNFSYAAIVDTIYFPESLSIKGRQFKSNSETIEIYQLYFTNKQEEIRFNQFIPFSQFLLANNKTPGIYFMRDSFLYLEYRPHH